MTKTYQTRRAYSLRCRKCGRSFRTTGSKQEIENIKNTIRCLDCKTVGDYRIIPLGEE